MRAEPERFIALGVARGERGYFASPFVQELKRQMPEPADADHCGSVRRFHVALHDRVKYRRAAAEKRAGLGGIELRGQRHHPNPMRAHAIREAAVSMHDRLLRGGAEVVVAGEALAARHATAGKPAKPDALPDAQALHIVADGGDGADDFVPRHERIGTLAPLIVDHRKVRVAETAMTHGDLNLLGAERAGIEIETLQWCAFFKRGEGFDWCAHRLLWFLGKVGCWGATEQKSSVGK